MGTEEHVYVCELKLKGQYKWARQFHKWCLCTQNAPSQGIMGD